MIALAATPVARAVDAHIQGTFKMRARVTVAVNVLGEFSGERLTRRWSITPFGCAGNVCGALLMTRRRADHRRDRLVLTRISAGRYAGLGTFYTGVVCRGRTYRRGVRVPYRIVVSVRRTTVVGGVRFARTIAARYINRRRVDRTPCRLGPSHDAARYSGGLASPLPVSPAAAFATQIDDATNAVAFTDTSTPGSRGGPIVGTAWNFGDPASGGAGTSDLPDPTHTYATPGSYVVTLTITASDGQVSSTAETVQVG